MNNKKTLILSIVGVLVLVIVVVGISYAMFSFVGDGTKENVITTGSISVNYADTTNILLTELYPESDAKGLAHDASYCSNSGETVGECTGTLLSSVLNFTVSSTMSSSTNISYEVGLDKQTSTLEDSEVKLWVKKTDKDSNVTYSIGTVNSGALISTITATAGSLANTTITGYKIAAGSFTATSQTDTYQVKAWVDENYNLPTTGPTTNGNAISSVTTSENYIFKIKVYAIQTGV